MKPPAPPVCKKSGVWWLLGRGGGLSPSRRVMLRPSSCGQWCRGRQDGVTGDAAARWEVTHDVSRSGDEAWAFLAGREGLIRAVVLILICKDFFSTGIIRLSITVFNRYGGRTQVP